MHQVQLSFLPPEGGTSGPVCALEQWGAAVIQY